MSTARRVAAGTSARNSSSRFAVNSPINKLTPVKLPPGRARLATRPSFTGSSGTVNTIGIVTVLGRQHRQSIHLIFGPAVYDCHVIAFDIAVLLQALAKSAQPVREDVRRCGVEEPNDGHP